MADESIQLHESATLGTFRRRLSEIVIEQLSKTPSAKMIQKIGIYESGDSGCGSFDILLVFLTEAAKLNPQAVIQQLKELQWIHDEKNEHEGTLQFSRIS